MWFMHATCACPVSLPILMCAQCIPSVLKDALHNSGEDVVVRIGMGCKAHLAANSRRYWPEMQRRRPPEAVLPQTAGSYAEHP
jgi:hypothetical protein